MNVEDFMKGAGVLGSFAGLAYWTGRWYKEWYFAQFGITYEALGFDVRYYLFGSWATIATAISVFILVAVPFSIGWWRFPRAYLAIALLLSTAALVVQIRHPLFSPKGPLWRIVFGSQDIAVWVCGVVALILFVVALIRNPDATLAFQRAYFSFGVPRIVQWIAGSVLSCVYLAAMGYAVGNYHGQAAIWDGKMNTRWVKFENSWWIFAARPNVDRNFIYDRINRKTKVVKDADIVEWDGPVTREPK